MELKVLFGEDVDTSFLAKLDRVDEACYDPQWWGELENTVVRYEKEPRQFVFLLDEETDELAGYLNFFPCENDLYLDNLYRSPVIRDDDITPDEVAPWRHDVNHVFIISLCIHPDYQGSSAIKVMTKAFIDYLNHLQTDLGYPITDIMGTTVSPDGLKALRNLLFRQVRTLEDGDVVCMCDGLRLKALLEGQIYIKHYHDDVYLMIPLTEHESNLRAARLFEPGACTPRGSKESNQLGDLLIDRLQEFISYECTNDAATQIEFANLGTFEFLHTSDDYECATFDPTVTDALETYDSYRWTTLAQLSAADLDEEHEVVLGTANGHVMLAAHRSTRMFVLIVMLPDYPFSTSQLEDQVTFGYLKVLDPDDRTRFVPLREYLLKQHGLHFCGQAKCVSYLSAKPRDPRELEDILAAEAYNNVERHYVLTSPEITALAQQNRAQFADYEVYLSSRAIAYLPQEFSPEARKRIEDFSDYLFVVVMTLFQNTALAKVNMRVTHLLESPEGVSPADKLAIDLEYGRTVRFWETQNFRYLPTQLESAVLRDAFGNRALKDTYDEHQEYLEHLVSVQTAINESRHDMIINILATMLAIIQIQPFMVDLLKDFYGWLGIQASYAESTINYSMFGGLGLFVLIIWIVGRRKRFSRRGR